MSVRKAKPVAPRPQMVRRTLVGESPMTSQAHEVVSDAIARMQKAGDRVPLTMDLIIGDNRVNHGLGRKPSGVHLTPTVADATFAWAMTSSDEKQLVVTVIGAAQPGARLEVY